MLDTITSLFPDAQVASSPIPAPGNVLICYNALTGEGLLIHAASDKVTVMLCLRHGAARHDYNAVTEDWECKACEGVG
jgi:hypothetical protein